MSNVIADVAIRAAEAIGHCDFRTAVSCYTTGKGNPWVITVGESSWQRHLVVIRTRGEDVELGILPKSQSVLSAIDMMDTRHFEGIVMLSDLTALSYGGIRELLQ